MAHTNSTSPKHRPRLLSAARARFERFGYHHTTISDIAHDAGVATGTMYRYFRNKEEIFLAVVRDATENWLLKAQAIVTAPTSPIERLARLGQASIEHNRRNRLLNSIFQRDSEMILAPLLDTLHEELISKHLGLMAGVIRDGIEQGCFRRVDPEKAAFVLFLAGHALFDQKRYPYEEVLPVFAEIAMGGLLSP